MHAVYGIISQGRLVVVPPGYPGARPVAYEDVPLFDQETEYVVQGAPIDASNHIYMPVAVRELPPQENDDPEST